MYIYEITGIKIKSCFRLGLNESVNEGSYDIEILNKPYEPFIKDKNYIEEKISGYDVFGKIIKVMLFPEYKIFYIDDMLYFKIKGEQPISIECYCKEPQIVEPYLDTMVTELFSIVIRDFSYAALHAGCIEFNKHRILIFGDGGTGKSTFVSSLCMNDGVHFLSDDMSLIQKNSDETLSVTGVQPFFKLWNRSIEAVGISDDVPRQLVMGTANKYIFDASDVYSYKSNLDKIDLCILLNRTDLDVAPDISLISPMSAYMLFIKSQIAGFALTKNEWSKVHNIGSYFNMIPFYEFTYKSDLEKVSYHSQTLLERIDSLQTA